MGQGKWGSCVGISGAGGLRFHYELSEHPSRTENTSGASPVLCKWVSDAPSSLPALQSVGSELPAARSGSGDGAGGSAQARLTEGGSSQTPPFLPTDVKVNSRAAEGALVDLADVVESLLRSLGDTLAGAVRLLIGGKASERGSGWEGLGAEVLRGSHSPPCLGWGHISPLCSSLLTE